MGQASDSGGGIGDFARSLFGARYQLRKARDGERWSDRDKHRVLRYEPDRQKILRHVDGNIWRRGAHCCFQTWVSPSATIRKATSGVLPAAESVMICTGLFGYGPVCASASPTAATASNHASTKVQLAFI